MHFVVYSFDYRKKINLDYYPDDIQFIDQTLDKYNLNNGYAIWGYGNRLIFLSKRSLRIIPHHKKKPLHWDTNKKWMYQKPQFIINLNPEDFGYKTYKTINKNNIYIHIL